MRHYYSLFTIPPVVRGEEDLYNLYCGSAGFLPPTCFNWQLKAIPPQLFSPLYKYRGCCSPFLHRPVLAAQSYISLLISLAFISLIFLLYQVIYLSIYLSIQNPLRSCLLQSFTVNLIIDLAVSFSLCSTVFTFACFKVLVFFCYDVF